MSNIKCLITLALSSSLIAACSGASFTGTAPSRATSQPTPEDSVKISCTATPETAKPGDKVEIAVTTVGWADGLYQTVLVGDANDTAELAFKNGSYTLKDGSANEIVAKDAGVTKIELRRDQTAATADATCQFTVADADASTETPPPPASSTDPATDPSTPPCTPDQQSTGAQIAFLIDNSNSNSATDCPSPKGIGTFQGTDLYECQDQTNREKAVLAAFDLLQQVGDNEPGNAAARSSLAVASFPTTADYVNGWANETNGWLEVASDSRGQTSTALQFTRKPSGLTPYGAAMTAASQLFGTAPADGRARVAVLVTDGEPTDSDPNAVATQADALRQAGVDVITVYITGPDERSSRIAQHTQMMSGIDSGYLQNYQEHWYAASYSNFDSYITALVGGNGTPSLVQRVSSKSDASCQDSTGQICDRNIVEVQDATALKDAFLNIIKTQAIACKQ